MSLIVQFVYENIFSLKKNIYITENINFKPVATSIEFNN